MLSIVYTYLKEMSRWVKQFIYGVLYLGIASLVVYGLAASGVFSAATCFDNRQNQKEEEIDCGGPCVACAIKKLQPIRSEVQTFGIDGNTNVVLILSNPNLTYGASSFNYTINFYDQAGGKIFSLTKNSFIYPAEAPKMIIEPNLRFNPSSVSGSPEVIIENLEWRPAAEFGQPRTQARQVQIQTANRQASVTGIIANRESFGLTRVSVGAILINKTTRVPVGASKTVLLDIRPFEERAFKISAPLSVALKVSDLDILLTIEARR